MRTTPMPQDLDYLGFARQLGSIAHITHIPRPIVSTYYGEPIVRWCKIRCSPLVSKRLLAQKIAQPLQGQHRFFYGTRIKGALGGEVDPTYDQTRAIALNMRYNNRSAHWDFDPVSNKWVRKGRNPMAKVILPALSSVASGKVGDIVFMRRGGQNIARIRVKPSNPQTAAQTLVRGNLSGLAQAWRFAGQTGNVTLTRAPSTPVTFAYLTAAEKASWSNFQAFVGTNVRLLSDGSAPVRSGS